MAKASPQSLGGLVALLALATIHCAAPRPLSGKTGVTEVEGDAASGSGRGFATLAALEEAIYQLVIGHPDATPGELFPGAALKRLTAEFAVVDLVATGESVQGSYFLDGTCGTDDAIFGMRGPGSDESAGDWILHAARRDGGWTVASLIKVPAFADAALGQFGGAGCEVAIVIETPLPADGDPEADCRHEYAAALVNPLGLSARQVPLGTFACPRSWWKCGPTPACDRGASSGVEWGVNLVGTFPVGASGLEGLLLAVSEPEGQHYYFYGADQARQRYYGKRRADRRRVRGDKIELLTCDDWRGIRVVGIFDGSLADYNEPPQTDLDCAKFF